MAALISMEEFAHWVQQPPEVLEEDERAAYFLEKASNLVRDKGRPDWESYSAPDGVKTIVAIVARRTYDNTRQLVAETTGPLSERFLEEAAAGMRLLDHELAEIQAAAEIAPESETAGTLWFADITSGRTPPVPPTKFIHDNSGSDWAIPFFDPSDPNYPED